MMNTDGHGDPSILDGGCSGPPTMPAPTPAPWYAEGSTGDFSMSELYTFALVLDELDVFEGVSELLYYFEKPSKWSGEHDRWVSLGRPSEPGEDESEYILDSHATEPTFEAWKAKRDEDLSEMGEQVRSITSRIASAINGRGGRR